MLIQDTWIEITTSITTNKFLCFLVLYDLSLYEITSAYFLN